MWTLPGLLHLAPKIVGSTRVPPSVGAVYRGGLAVFPGVVNTSLVWVRPTATRLF